MMWVGFEPGPKNVSKLVRVLNPELCNDQKMWVIQKHWVELNLGT